MGIGNQNIYVTEEFISRGTSKEETFAGRNFCDFADFGPFPESLFHKIFNQTSSAKVYSMKVLKNYYYVKFSAFLLTFTLPLFVVSPWFLGGKHHIFSKNANFECSSLFSLYQKPLIRESLLSRNTKISGVCESLFPWNVKILWGGQTVKVSSTIE